MKDHIRERAFALHIIATVLALYITQDDFRAQVDASVNDGYSISISGEKLSDYEQAEMKIMMSSTELAEEITKRYFAIDDEFDELEDDEDTADTPQTDCPWK